MAGGHPGGAVPAAATITNAAKVRQIASLVDGLPLFPPGMFSCSIDTGHGIKLTFRGAGSVLAVATIHLSGCGGVGLTVRDVPQPILSGGVTLARQALSAAGLHWPGYQSRATLPTGNVGVTG
jgi:hypothetical protein